MTDWKRDVVQGTKTMTKEDILAAMIHLQNGFPGYWCEGESVVVTGHTGLSTKVSQTAERACMILVHATHRWSGMKMRRHTFDISCQAMVKQRQTIG
jgi:hypothetical protein